jgi:Ca2+:H+ antiporter
MKIGKFEVSILNVFLIFVPIAFILRYTHADGTWIFVVSGIAIIPLAGLLGEATEHLSEHVGPGVGGLLNATFGNAAELIIAIFALKAGLYEVVKASITGSIIGNILLVLGLSVVVGGFRFKTQKFNATAAGMNSTLLILSTAGLVVPAVFFYLLTTHGVPAEEALQLDLDVSLEVSIVLFVTYILSLIFSLQTHKHLFDTTDYESPHDGAYDVWTVKKSATVLALATLGVVFMSEFLVHTIEDISEKAGMTQVFIGVIIVAIVGNAAEHSAAVMMAWKNKMDISVTIAIGSSSQVALFVAPALVFLSFFIGPAPMDLVFSPLEVLSIVLASILVNFVALDGEFHWMEGIQLLAVYIILGIAFFYLPEWGPAATG